MGQRGRCSDLHLGCGWAFATNSFVSWGTGAVVSFATQGQRNETEAKEEEEGSSLAQYFGTVNKTRALCKTLSMHNTTVSFFQWRIGCSNVSAFRFDKRAQI